MNSLFPIIKPAFRRLMFLLPLLLTTAIATAQQAATTDDVPMADQLRADGKIWVVIAVIALVFAGIIVYLARLDGQIGKLEKAIKSDKTINTNA